MTLRHGLTLGLLAAVMGLILAYVAVRATYPSYPYPWTAYALSRQHGRLELIVDGTPTPLEYRSRDDCIAAASAEVAKPIDPAGRYRPDAAGYAAPYGCHYSGYPNSIVQRIATVLLRPHRFRCIVKIELPSPDPQRYLYFPTLPGLPSGDEGYCVP